MILLYSCFSVQRFGQPIEDKHRENEDRPRAFEELGKKLQLYMKAVDCFKQKVSTIGYIEVVICLFYQIM